MEAPHASLEALLSDPESPVIRYQAIEDDDRPSSLFDCVDHDNQIIPDKYVLFLEKEEELEEAENKIFECLYADGPTKGSYQSTCQSHPS